MKVAFYLKRPDSPYDTAIFARISYNEGRLKYYIKEAINPKYWNPDKYRAKETKEYKEYPDFNKRIEDIESAIKNVFRRFLIDNENNPPHPDDLKVLLDKEIKGIEPIKGKLHTFFGYYEDLIERSKNGKRLQPKNAKRYSKATINVYENTLKKLNDFQKTRRRIIDFKTIDLDFYYDFLQYLNEEFDSSTNTIGKDIKTLKTILNDATERGYNTNLAFRSRSFISPTEESDSIYLNKEELSEMSALDLSSKPELDNVRYAFLIGCYTGLRYSDFSLLTLDHMKGDYIEIKPQKTNTWITIPIHKELIKLLKEHNGILPKSLSNSDINSLLKDLGKLMDSLQSMEYVSITKGGMKIEESYHKWELLTSHTARRSFATNEYIAGAKPLTIMAITGHKTEKSFLKYLKLDGKDQAKILRQDWIDRDKLSVV
jgi:site-specific recombinase XerD